MQNVTQINANSDFTLNNLALSFPASAVMDYHSPFIREIGDHLYVGYLSDDTDCSNPLDMSEGMGRLYSAHRSSLTHAEMQQALGLDSYWNKQYELMADHLDVVRSIWVDMASSDSDFVAWAEKSARTTTDKSPSYFKSRARSLWKRMVTDPGVTDIAEAEIWQFDFTAKAVDSAWFQLRSNGLVGDPHAVVLDCYDHGGQSWSITGHGMQCRFDTSTGAGVWVPDNVAREEIERRAAVYAFGSIHEEAVQGGSPCFRAVIDNEFGLNLADTFDSWGEAFEWIQQEAETRNLAESSMLDKSMVRRGHVRAAQEIAKSSLEQYNDWLSGNCFGAVCVIFEKVNVSNGTEHWIEIESDECWGFVGDDHAMESLKDTFMAMIKNKQEG